jgi:hypothetical protein
VAGLSDNSVTNAAIQMVAGQVDTTATVSVQVNDGAAVAATMTENNFSLPVTLVSGQNTIQVTATDAAGKFGTVKRTVILDNINPALAVTNPAQDITIHQTSITLRGTVSNLTAATVTVTVDGVVYTPQVTNGEFQQYIAFTAEKTYAVTVTAKDTAGNTTTVQRNIIYTAGLSLSPSSLSFGNQAKNTASPAQTVTVTNIASTTVAVKNVHLGGANPAQFEQTSGCPSKLAAGASCTISVVFKPTRAGAMSADLKVSGIAVPLTGTGTRK